MIALDIDSAAAESGSCRTVIYNAIREGKLRARKHGRRTLILREDLEDYLRKLPVYSPETATDVPANRARRAAA